VGPRVDGDQLERVTARAGHVLAGPCVGAHGQDRDHVGADGGRLGVSTFTSVISVDFTPESGIVRATTAEHQGQRRQSAARPIRRLIT